MDDLGILEREGTVFVLIDIQEKFLPAMQGMDKAISNADILVKASGILGIPLIVTGQYPKGLGKTTGRIALPAGAEIIEKVSFGSDGFRERLEGLGKGSVVIFGVEAHVCILKTALDAMKEGFRVHVVADAMTSRTERNRDLAMERLRRSGAFIASTEMVLFQLMERSGTDESKAISGLIR